MQEAWTGGRIHALPVADNLSVELVQVSVFLAAFSGLYFTVTVLTDETYRDQFFTGVMAELDQAVGVRAVYLALRRAKGATRSARTHRDRHAVERGVAGDVEPLGVGEVVDRDPRDASPAWAIRTPSTWCP